MVLYNLSWENIACGFYVFYRHGHNVIKINITVFRQSAGLSTQPSLAYIITHNDTPKPDATRAGIQTHIVGHQIITE